MIRILFLCTGNSGRSQMASAFAKDIAPKNIEVLCAGDKHYTIQDNAVRVMKEIHYNIPDKVEIAVKDIKSERLDIVVTLCNHAKEICPVFPGSPAKIHWPLADPGKRKLNNKDKDGRG